MTVLTALHAHYGRLAARGDVAPYGYSTEPVSYMLTLSAEGEPVSVRTLGRTERKKPVPASLMVPQSFKRPGTTPRAFFLWDNTKFVLGLGKAKDGEGVAYFPQHHAAFRELHEELIGDGDDEGLQAVLRFVRTWTPERFARDPFKPEMLDQTFVFHLDGDRPDGKPRYIHDRPAGRAIWERRVAAAEAPSAMCLVTGRIAPVARLHPAIKGVRDAQTSGASLVSFNLDAFTSYGKEQGENAPVADAVAAGYGAALNALLARDSRCKVQIGDATTVFWADAGVYGEAAARAAEDVVGEVLSGRTEGHDEQERADADETRKLREVLERIADGRALRELDTDLRPDTRFHILGLSPNAARLSVRFWHETTLAPLAAHLLAHWRDLDIDPPAWKGEPKPYALLYALAPQEKMENASKQLGGELARAVLTGDRYPRALLAAVIQRLRAGNPVNGARAAIAKAVVMRDLRIRRDAGEIDKDRYEEEEVPVSLDRSQTNAAYRMGRLFAVLEGMQRAALGRVNASIRNRYFGAASATPASVFPLLLRGSNHHLSVLRKNTGTTGLAVYYEKEIGEIVDALPMDLPRHLGLEDQGRFVVGYYHQRNARRPADGTGTADAEADSDTDTADQE